METTILTAKVKKIKKTDMENDLLIAEVKKRAEKLNYDKDQFKKDTGGVPRTFENVIYGRHNPRLLYFLTVVDALGGKVKIEWNDK